MIDPVQSMMNGDISFLKQVWSFEWPKIVERIRKSTYYNQAVNTCYRKLICCGFSEFLFKLVYDNEIYQEFVIRFIEKSPKLLKDDEVIAGILRTNYGLDFLLEKNALLNDLAIRLITMWAIKHKEAIPRLLLVNNFKIRAAMLKNIVLFLPGDFYNYVPNIYDVIKRDYDEYGQYFIVPDRMDVDDLSHLAVLLGKNDEFKDLYIELKQYILDNYEKNELAKYLIMEDAVSEFASDADRLFITSKTYQVNIMDTYSGLINRALVEEFEKSFGVYMTGARVVTGYAISFGLGDKLKLFTEKYLDLSSDKTFESLKSGGCARVFRLGDYVLKMGIRKHSYEEVLCPDIFLAVKNLEEIILRDENHHVRFALEVQSLLTRGVQDLDGSYFELFHKALNDLGYYSADTRDYPNWVKNCRLLNDFREADCANFSALPDWFKDKPVVLVDRDLVFKLSNKTPRMLISSWEL